MRSRVTPTLLLLGCVHGPRQSHAEAEAALLGRYAGRMSQACQERFELERQRSSVIITTMRGIQETEATISTCKQSLAFTLDCHMPYKGLGWSCHDHFLPTPEGMDDPLDQADELALVLAAVEGASCDGDPARASHSSLVLSRSERRAVERDPLVLRSLWSAELCGQRWSVETRCVYAGIRRLGDCSLTEIHAVEADQGGADSPSLAPSSETPG